MPSELRESEHAARDQRANGAIARDQWQAQAPPQPPPAAGAPAFTGVVPLVVTDVNPVSLRIVLVWPLGQAAGSDDWLIGRSSSKSSSQVTQRYT